MMHTQIIAEAGVNHNGSLERAFELVEVAAAAGADAVKFQSFKPELLVSRHAPKAEYQKKTTGTAESQLDMLRKLALSESEQKQLQLHCVQHGIEFLSTPFDPDSLHFLVNEMQLPRLKLGSGDLTNGPLLLEIARAGIPLILSTGMATLEEIEQALAVLAFGYTNATDEPCWDAFKLALNSTTGQQALGNKLTLLHCTTEYPCPFEDVNLRAMDTLVAAFGLPVGLSDHTDGIAVALAAVARGAGVIEKHFTLDKSLPGPDHRASLDPDELRQLVTGIRQIETAMGNGVKQPSPRERGNIAAVRKSLVAATGIASGEKFSPANLTIKRPGTGLSPMEFWNRLDQPAGRAYEADEEIAP